MKAQVRHVKPGDTVSFGEKEGVHPAVKTITEVSPGMVRNKRMLCFQGGHIHLPYGHEVEVSTNPNPV